MRSRSSSTCAIMFLLSQQHTDNRCRHEVGHGSGAEGAESEPGELVTALRDECADAADLDADGTEVGEAAECEGGDGEGAWIEGVFERPEIGKGDELVDDHARAQQVANDRRRVPRDADEPCDWRKNPAENFIERGGEGNVVRAEPVMYTTEDAVDQRDERDEGDEHDGDVEGEAPAVDGAARDSAKEVFFAMLFRLGEVHVAEGVGYFGFGHQHLRDEDSTGRGHDDGCEQMLSIDAIQNICGHDATRDMGHAAGHDGHE